MHLKWIKFQITMGSYGIEKYGPKYRKIACLRNITPHSLKCCVTSGHKFFRMENSVIFLYTLFFKVLFFGHTQNLL